MIEVQDVRGKGRGLIATSFIPQAMVIESAPVVEFSADITQQLINSAVAEGEKVLAWTLMEDKSPRTSAFACGLMMLCNHGTPANAEIHKDFQGKRAALVATRDIFEGQEVLLDYTIVKSF